MPRFTKTQYDHFHRRFRDAAKGASSVYGGAYKKLTDEEKIARILDGRARLRLPEGYRATDGGKVVCDYTLQHTLEAFDYPEDEDMAMHNIVVGQKAELCQEAVAAVLNRKLDDYVVGLIDAVELKRVILDIEAMDAEELAGLIKAEKK